MFFNRIRKGPAGFEPIPMKIRKSMMYGTIDTTDPARKRVVVLDRARFSYVGSCLVAADKSWVVHSTNEDTNNLIAICIDDTGNFNADIFDSMDLCEVSKSPGPEWDTWLIQGAKYRRRFIEPLDWRPGPFNSDPVLEDVRGTITKFKFDTIGTKPHLLFSVPVGDTGRYLDAGDLAVSVGPGQTNPKILPGSHINRTALITASPRKEPQGIDNTLGEEATHADLVVDYINGDGTGSGGVQLRPVFAGPAWVTDYFGDGSCVVHLPLDRDLKEVHGIPTSCHGGFNYPYGMSQAGVDALGFSSIRNQALVLDWRITAGTDYTFVGWFRLSSGYDFIMGQGRDFGVHMYSNDLRGWRNTSATGWSKSQWNWNQNPVRTSWHQLAITLGSTEARWYENGAQRVGFSGNYAITPNLNAGGNRSGFYLGLPPYDADILGEGYDRPNYFVYNFRIFNRILSAAEISSLYAADSAAGPGRVVSLDYIHNFYTGLDYIAPARGGAGPVFNALTFEKPGASGGFIGADLNSIEIKSRDIGGVRQPVFDQADGKNRGAFRACGYNTTYYPNKAFDGSVNSSNRWQYNAADTIRGVSQLWFEMNMDDFADLHGFAWKITDQATYNSSPLMMEVYGSRSGRFDRPEEYIYLGKMYAYNTALYNIFQPWHKIGYGAQLKAFRVYITAQTTAQNDYYCAIEDMVVGATRPAALPSKYGRSIVIDCADNYGATEMGLGAVRVRLSGCGVSQADWQAYATTSSSGQGPEKLLENYINGSNNGCWKSAAAVNSNQRVILVADQPFYFDDVLIENYNIERVTGNQGVQNFKIRVSTDVITDTTYDAAVANTVYESAGVMPKYPSVWWLDRFYAPFEYSKPVKARAVIFDFHSNWGDSSYTGLRMLGFVHRGMSIFPSGWTYGGSSDTTGIDDIFNLTGGTFTGSITSYGWRGNAPGQRIWVKFPADIMMDGIMLDNSHNYGTSMFTAGVKDFTVTVTQDAADPPSGYNQAVTGGVTWMDTRCYRHAAGDWSERSNRYVGEPVRGAHRPYSVVFDFHDTEGNLLVWLSSIWFLYNGYRMEPDPEWTVYTNGNASGYTGAGLFNRRWQSDEFNPIQSESWMSAYSKGARMVIASSRRLLFNEICIPHIVSTDAGKKNGARHYPKNVTITITDTVLTQAHAVYDQAVPGGVVLQDGPLSRHPAYNPGQNDYQLAYRLDSKGIDNRCACLVHSDAPNLTTLFEDSSPTGYTLTTPIDTNGSPVHSTAQAKIGGSSINVSAGYLILNCVSRFALSTEPFSFGMWIYPNVVTGDMGLIAKWVTTGDQRSFKLALAAGYLSFRYSTTGADDNEFLSTGTLSAGAWTHVKVARVGSDLVLYINGAVDSTHTIGTAEIFFGSAPALLGAFDNNLSNCLDGYIDEFEMDFMDLHAADLAAFTPRTTARQVELGHLATARDSYFAFSFDGRVAYSVYTSGAWRDIATTDETIHGNPGDSDWYFRDNASVWSKSGIDNSAQSAVSAAVAAGANNRMSKAAVIAMTNTEWSATGGFDSAVGHLDIAYVNYQAGAGGYEELLDLTINGRKYWFSEVMDLEAITATIDYSKICWSHGYDEIVADYYADFASAFEVHSFVTGDTAWNACTNGAPIPSLANGTVTAGKTLQIRVTSQKFAARAYQFQPDVEVEVN